MWQMPESGPETSLLGTLEEISRLVVSHTGDPVETLINITRLIQRRFHSDVWVSVTKDSGRSGAESHARRRANTVYAGHPTATTASPATA